MEPPGETLKCFCLKGSHFWTAIEVMTPCTPGGVLWYLWTSSGSFGRFGSSHPWMIFLWGKKKETTAIRTYPFHSRLHMVFVFWHLSLRTSSNFYINFNHNSSFAGLDSLRSPTCIKEPWPPHDPDVCSLVFLPRTTFDRCRPLQTAASHVAIKNCRLPNSFKSINFNIFSLLTHVNCEASMFICCQIYPSCRDESWKPSFIVVALLLFRCLKSGQTPLTAGNVILNNIQPKPKHF